MMWFLIKCFRYIFNLTTNIVVAVLNVAFSSRSLSLCLSKYSIFNDHLFKDEQEAGKGLLTK